MRDSSSRERRIVAIARRETDPAYASQFEPITRGPVVAVLGVCAIGVIALPYMIWSTIAAVLRRGSPNE